MFFAVVLYLAVCLRQTQGYWNNALKYRSVGRLPFSNLFIHTYVKKSEIRKQDHLLIAIQSLNRLMDRMVEHINQTDTLRRIDLLDEYSRTTGFITRSQSVEFRADAFVSTKLEYLRRVYFQGAGCNVFNLIAIPKTLVEVPILGVDIVILPGEVLASIDFQPVGRSNRVILSGIEATGLDKWKNFLPPGGELPQGSEKFFSERAIWTRFPNDKPWAKLHFIEQAAEEYTKCYSQMLLSKSVIEDDSKIVAEDRQKSLEDYLEYRRENDPAKRMLIAAFGKNWTNKALSKVVFPQTFL